jgi:hypothetical protein
VIAASRAAVVDSVALSLEPRAAVDFHLAGLDVTKRWSVRAAFLRLDAPGLDQHDEVTVNDSRFSIGLDPLKPGLYLVWTWVEHAEISHYYQRYMLRSSFDQRLQPARRRALLGAGSAYR